MPWACAWQMGAPCVLAPWCPMPPTGTPLTASCPGQMQLLVYTAGLTGAFLYVCAATTVALCLWVLFPLLLSEGCNQVRMYTLVMLQAPSLAKGCVLTLSAGCSHKAETSQQPAELPEAERKFRQRYKKSPAFLTIHAGIRADALPPGRSAAANPCIGGRHGLAPTA